MVDLSFDVKVDLVMNGKICSPAALCSPARGISEGPADVIIAMEEAAEPSKVQGFYLAAWVGAGSQEFSLSRIDPSGEATVRKLKVKPGDVDTLKLAVAFKEGTRCCHLASSFIPVAELRSVLSEPAGSGGSKFAASQKCMPMKDNFTANKAVLRFSNAGTDVQALSRLSLKPSSLSSLEVTNSAIEKFSEHLKQSISHCAVSPLNAGVQFLESVTYGNMANHMTHYALLGHVFKSLSSPVSAAQLAYYGYQTMHSTNLSFDALHRMPDSELALRFGDPLITRHTADDMSMEYQGDKTFNCMGQVCRLRETEDIARTFSALGVGVRSDLDETVYPGVGQSVSGLSLAMAIDQLDRAGVTRTSKESAAPSQRISKALEVDDCENLSQANMLVARGLRDVVDASGSERGLASMIARETRGNHLFAACTDVHHAKLAKVLCRLGAMLKSGDWDTSFLVASAKAASYSLDNPGSASCLSGHGAAITRVRDSASGQYIHAAVEGTTYAAVGRPMPAGYPSVLPIKLAGQAGEPDKVVPMNLAELMTSVGQNIHKDLGISPRSRIQAHFLPEYQDPQDCPFYVSAFYTGLKEGPGASIGCVPVDTCPSAQYLAGEKPLFGAPVMGLSKPSTMAIPISSETFSAAGVPEPEKVLKLMAAQVEEAWPPMMTKSQLKSVMSYWQPVASPDLPSLTGDDYAHHIRSENCWGYDDPKHTALAVKVLSGLADRFNELQAKDPASDGSRAVAYGQFLSASLRVCLPVPKNTKGFSLSTMRNMRKAADDIGMRRLSACPLRARMIDARAKLKAGHGFYMCDKGEGLVHSYRYRLA